MFVKFKNLKNGKEFTVSENAAKHYKGDKKFLLLGTADENGTIKQRAVSESEDIGSLEDQLKAVRLNLGEDKKKATAEPAEVKGQVKSNKPKKEEATTVKAIVEGKSEEVSEEEEEEDNANATE